MAGRSTSAAERQRRCRHRRLCGRIVVKVELDEVALIDTLVRAELLDPARADDRDAIEGAFGRAIRAWIGDD